MTAVFTCRRRILDLAFRPLDTVMIAEVCDHAYDSQNIHENVLLDCNEIWRRETED